MPLLHGDEAQRLHTNTIEFLRGGCEALRRYDVPQRRGVLLLGEPGNGKTMACRWIRGQCQRRGLSWRNVSAEEFSHAMADGQAHALFQLPRRGVIFFDDFDSALRCRETDGTSTERSLFLSGLDGIHANNGVVYIFTSNVQVAEIDPAIRRPGRLDLIFRFRAPPVDLRQQLIATRWHVELCRQLDLDQVLRDTEGMSFAELEEMKKLLALQQIESGSCDWQRALRDFRGERCDVRPQTILGFAAPAISGPDPSIPQTAACAPDGRK
jgi:ATP-dependent 26S proteasome regulatory subunit